LPEKEKLENSVSSTHLVHGGVVKRLNHALDTKLCHPRSDEPEVSIDIRGVTRAAWPFAFKCRPLEGRGVIDRRQDLSISQIASNHATLPQAGVAVKKLRSRHDGDADDPFFKAADTLTGSDVRQTQHAAITPMK